MTCRAKIDHNWKNLSSLHYRGGSKNDRFKLSKKLSRETVFTQQVHLENLINKFELPWNFDLSSSQQVKIKTRNKMRKFILKTHQVRVLIVWSIYIGLIPPLCLTSVHYFILHLLFNRKIGNYPIFSKTEVIVLQKYTHPISRCFNSFKRE